MQQQQSTPVGVCGMGGLEGEDYTYFPRKRETYEINRTGRKGTS
jgi:hypothetical protein